MSKTTGPRDEHSQRAWDWWRKIGEPRHVCAPMVWNSELAFRLLVRRHGCQLTYTPMILARKFLRLDHAERLAMIEPDSHDRPLVVQFAADDPQTLLAAARLAEAHCDAVDLNLGCPQPQAVRDHYGSILMEEPELVEAMVRTASAGLSIPLTVKMRIFDDVERTTRFARMLEAAGASLLTVHGRTRSCTHHEGKCDWETIRAVKEAVRIPVIANGGMIRSLKDVADCLRDTGADAVMSAIGLLLDPRLFARTTEPYSAIDVALEYCDTAERVSSTTSTSMRQHLMAILRQALCPSYYRRGGDCDDHVDLWTLLCSNNIRSAGQCRQIVLTLAWRINDRLAPPTAPPTLKDIKKNIHVGVDVDGPVGGDDAGGSDELAEFTLDF